MGWDGVGWGGVGATDCFMSEPLAVTVSTWHRLAFVARAQRLVVKIAVCERWTLDANSRRRGRPRADTERGRHVVACGDHAAAPRLLPGSIEWTANRLTDSYRRSRLPQLHARWRRWQPSDFSFSLGAWTGNTRSK
jgi:hypothetical protein